MLRLVVLAAAAFVYVTAETLPIGLLPEISADMAVSESSVGLLLTFYAYGVAVMTMPLITFVRRWPRRRVVVVTVAALALSQLLSAVAVGYPMLVLARMVCAATHGVFWAVVAPVAASLVAPNMKGKAIATVYAGTSLALVAGNPLTAALGQWLGWRTAAACIGVVSAAIAVTLFSVLPKMPVNGPARKSRSRVLDRSLVVICVATFLAVLGHFIAYTYFSLLVDRGVGSIGTTLTLMLLLYGLCGVVGIWIVGKTFDRWPRRSTIVSLSVVAAALLLLWSTLQSAPGSLAVLAVVAIGLWGLAFTTVPVCLQSSVLNTPRADPDRASAIYVVSFQVAIASGALVGGVLIDRTSIAVVTFIAMALIVAALVTVLGARGVFRGSSGGPNAALAPVGPAPAGPPR
ncbi:Predicted arabinose efflux permease, MFS family [Rhodococcoides kyotonense]|uniref:Predicted arabinose efflux permease, MFS family n=1 Tax=Rhodococcoides kyotonense TaxID=398843 RepID=A0A239L6C5_9NOCA|nr:Predicted arabinose efflux permease, MFS family [Rhodococcus kyotonensis]